MGDHHIGRCQNERQPRFYQKSSYRVLLYCHREQLWNPFVDPFHNSRPPIPRTQYFPEPSSFIVLITLVTDTAPTLTQLLDLYCSTTLPRCKRSFPKRHSNRLSVHLALALSEVSSLVLQSQKVTSRPASVVHGGHSLKTPVINTHHGGTLSKPLSLTRLIQRRETMVMHLHLLDPKASVQSSHCNSQPFNLNESRMVQQA